MLRIPRRALRAARQELRHWGFTTDRGWWQAAGAWTVAIAIVIGSALTNPAFPAVHV